MAKHSKTWVNILVISKNIINMVKLSGKYYLLTIQEIIKSHTDNLKNNPGNGIRATRDRGKEIELWKDAYYQVHKRIETYIILYR